MVQASSSKARLITSGRAIEPCFSKASWNDFSSKSDKDLIKFLGPEWKKPNVKKLLVKNDKGEKYRVVTSEKEEPRKHNLHSKQVRHGLREVAQKKEQGF